MKTITPTEAARRIGVHDNTIRNWSGDYAAFLSAGAATGKHGRRRKYTEKDVLVLATIADLRNRGFTPVQVVDALSAGTRIEVATPQAEAARPDVGLVPAAQLQQAFIEIQRISAELEQVRAERDRALERGDKVSVELNATIAELQNQLGRAEGALAERFSPRLVIGLVVLTALLVAVVVVLLLRA